jgi:hypothetical protein
MTELDNALQVNRELRKALELAAKTIQSYKAKNEEVENVLERIFNKTFMDGNN